MLKSQLITYSCQNLLQIEFVGMTDLILCDWCLSVFCVREKTLWDLKQPRLQGRVQEGPRPLVTEIVNSA